MLTTQEKEFISYWEANRLRRKKIGRQLFIGLPLGTLLVTLILVSSLSGWYRRAMMKINVNSSLVIVLLAASMLIVVFIVVFSVRHRWEMDEQRYHELKAKEKQSSI
jgi:heme/copper-type cytochrome/quinol oxidase subunit 2